MSAISPAHARADERASGRLQGQRLTCDRSGSRATQRAEPATATPQGGVGVVSDCLFCRRGDGGWTSREHVIPESMGNTELILPPGVVCDRNCVARSTMRE